MVFVFGVVYAFVGLRSNRVLVYHILIHKC